MSLSVSVYVDHEGVYMHVCVSVRVCVLPAVLIEGEHLDDERTPHCQRAAQIVPVISR